MIIQHNIMALNAHRQLGGNNSLVSKNLEKLSSGFRINRAGDDAAGLAISEKMRAQITGLSRAQSNAQDGISLVQTAEGALTEVHSMLNRMVDLATQASNGTMKSDDRGKIQDEMNALVEEIDRISQSTNFNGINLLDGSMGTGTTGAKITTTTTDAVTGFTASISGVPAGTKVNFATGDGTATGVTAEWAGGELTIKFNNAAAAAAEYTQSMIDDAISKASGAPSAAAGIKVTIEGGKVSSTGKTAADAAMTGGVATAAKAVKASATQNSIVATANQAGSRLGTAKFQITTAASPIGVFIDATTGAITANLDKNKEYSADEINAMLREAGADVSVSFDGTKKDTGVLFTNSSLAGGEGLGSGGGLTLQIGDTAEQFNKVTVQVDDMGAQGLNIKGISVADQDVAAASIKTIKEAINKVSTNRSAMGAMQNRLEHTINNLSVATENMTAAESRIRDVDMAKEMMHFTKNNVLSQAAQAMLAQANQQPQQVLQLLR